MTALDWFIIMVYLCAMIGLSVYLGRSQSDEEDYFVGGRKLSWWAVGLSTMATQTSAISFISIPAFVALKEGGGLTWLQYELAVPLAIILTMAFLIPFFRKLELVSVYEYLEWRFGPSVRYLVSAVFLISRGLATGVGVYASGIVLAVCLGIPLWLTILIIGVVTVIYDTIGGITAVVYSDVIQMVVLISGIFVCIVYATGIVGGLDEVWSSFPAARRTAIDPSAGLKDAGTSVPFWAFLFGGIFLYTSYYGTDQSQVQRELSAATMAETKKSLLLNGFARFPLTALYALLGILMLAVLQHSPELNERVPYNQPDYLVPQFILLYLPQGLRALIFASLLSAAMSSLDSALNSLSASTVHDFIAPRLKNKNRLLLVSKLTTISWGILITGFAFLVGDISETVIESINKIGSAFYGPILAAFIVGVLTKKATARSITAGILTGVGFNLVLWLAMSAVYWMWWNMTGFLIAAAVSNILCRIAPETHARDISHYVLTGSDLLEAEQRWWPMYAALILYFLLLLTVLMSI
ncbi:SSS sodium solute transporter superfamily [Olavius algarvensis Delta 1 endosymbiont]|nr:SSS sodium solute transporter superfamily [Olavius algarvensis Delta 1 endosymbiont]